VSGLDVIVEYVEGRMKPNDFCEHLYKSKELEDLLSEDVRLPPYTNNGTIYLYLLNLDFLRPGG
jgi:hypothetical protein